MRRISHVVVHCSGADASTVESMRRYHIENKGWSDVGYHKIVYANGSLHDGRAEARPGAHVEEFNANTLAVCMVGDLNAHPPTPAQLAAAVAQAAKWCAEHRLSADKVLGHRETGPYVPAHARTKKPCPGTTVSMEDFRARVATLLRSPAVTDEDIMTCPKCHTIPFVHIPRVAAGTAAQFSSWGYTPLKNHAATSKRCRDHRGA